MPCGNCDKRRVMLNQARSQQTTQQQDGQDRSQELRTRTGPTGCQCEFKDGESQIFCERHQAVKTRSLYELCNLRHDYFQLWEDEVGPFQGPQGISKPEESPSPEKEEASKESTGLGDTIEKITKATGIRAVVDTVSKMLGKDCGCEGRKEWLNSKVPYKPKKTKGFFE